MHRKFMHLEFTHLDFTHRKLMRRAVLFTGFVLALGGCAGSVPVAVLTSRGGTLRGTVARAGLRTAFEVSNGRLSCSGIYPLVGDAKVVTVTLRCNDGRTGIALVTHQDAFNGGGTVRFSDGTEGSFVFGDGATTI